MTLTGRTAIVTGASVGLGAAIAEHFAAAGASVMICARNAADLEAERKKIFAEQPGARVRSFAPLLQLDLRDHRRLLVVRHCRTKLRARHPRRIG